MRRLRKASLVPEHRIAKSDEIAVSPPREIIHSMGSLCRHPGCWNEGPRCADHEPRPAWVRRRVLELHSAGTPPSRIAEEVGRTERRVRQVLAEFGVGAARLMVSKDDAVEIPPEGLVYIARFDDYIKIGFTAGQPAERLRDIFISGPFQSCDLLAVLDGGRVTEKRLHRLFSEFNIRGEWFWPARPVMAYIVDLAQPVRVRISA